VPTRSLELLLESIQPARHTRSWHGGPTPAGSLRGVDAAQARWTPAPRRKNIWQLTLHITYWKYAVRRHFEPAPVSRFPRRPSNWPEMPSPPTEAAWARDVALLKEEHRLLLAAIRRLPERKLSHVPPDGRRWSYGELILGIASHDAYHTGQIQLLKRLWQERGR